GSFLKSGITLTPNLETYVFAFYLLHSRERRFAIVAEPANPILPRGPAQPVDLGVDALEWVQIESGHPGRCQMRRRGRQIREETERLAAAGRGHNQHVPIMT